MASVSGCRCITLSTTPLVCRSFFVSKYEGLILVGTGGDAFVHINGEKFRVRDLNVRAGVHHTVPVSVVLKKKNVLTFSVESDDNTFAAHLDGIEVLDGTEEEIEVQL